MLLLGDCLLQLKTLEACSVQTCVTSPPYWGLRDYGHKGQLGLERTPEEFVQKLIEIFREVRRVLKDDGTLWLNLGDSYAGSWGNQSRREHRGKQRAINKEQIQDFRPYGTLEGATNTGSLDRTPGLKGKDLVGIPWRVAFALQADGWYLRQDIIWHKPNPMPESVRDRCTKSHEYIFLLSKSRKYYFDHEAIKEPSKDPRGPGNKFPVRKVPGQRTGDNSNLRGSLHNIGLRETRNKRSVWTVTSKPFKGAHFATFPIDLIEPCILAGAPNGGVVLDPFAGSGTVGVACKRHDRKFVGIELNQEYLNLASARIESEPAPESRSELETQLEFISVAQGI